MPELRHIAYKGALPYDVPLPVEHVRALVDTPDEIKAQERAHIMDLAAFLQSTTRIDPSVGLVGLRASEQRHYDKRVAVIRELRHMIPSERAAMAAPPTLSADYASRVLALEV